MYDLEELRANFSNIRTTPCKIISEIFFWKRKIEIEIIKNYWQGFNIELEAIEDPMLKSLNTCI